MRYFGHSKKVAVEGVKYALTAIGVNIEERATSEQSTEQYTTQTPAPDESEFDQSE
jgi:hypothetical protein